MSTIRILCLGDSLTEGYGLMVDAHPYCIEMEKRLQSAFPDEKVNVVEDGVAGDLVTDESFSERLEEHLTEASFHWVIILGGTNDLGYRKSPSTVFESLTDLYNTALASGAKVLALTIPECYAIDIRLDTSRDQLNKLIMEHGEPNYQAFDLKTHIPYHSLSEAEQTKYWSDGLHLTPVGYDLMGGFIGDALVDLIKQGRNDSTTDQSAEPGNEPV